MAAYSLISDGDLFTLFKGGNEKAYEEIYKRFWALLYRHARRLLHDDDGAEDVVQEVFLTLWNKAPVLDLKGSLSGYLYNAVRNKIFDQIAHGKVRAKYMASLEVFLENGDCQTDHLVRERQLKDLIEQEIAALPEAMRRAFELSRNSNLSYKEIAEELGVSEGVVRNQISRALKILRTRLGDIALIYLFLNL
jgi:RNA polymerase sigma-70 factor (family 1)